MSITTTAPATLEDLMQVEGKAELIAGRIVRLMASGVLPAVVAKRIYRKLDDYGMLTGFGEAFPDGLGYALDTSLPSGRQSFQPDVSFQPHPFSMTSMKFMLGAPIFAVEVRSENDYGPAQDREYAEKRDDYFTAGTQVVWDVDPVAGTVACYRANDPTTPTVFHRGEVANAEPALPGWRLPLDELFG